MAAVIKTKPASNAANKKSKQVAANDTAKFPSATPVPSESTVIDYGASGKPDRALFDKEQENIKVDIESLQAKMSAIRDKIGLSSKNGPGNDKRTQIRNELENIRTEQSTSKFSRGKVLDQLKQLQDGIQKKIKDLNANRSKSKYKTIAEVDARISELDRQVESGTLKLADEKRALQEITQTRRLRKTVEGFQAEQDAIDREKAKEEELRKQLDDPEAKAMSDRYEQLQAEFDELKKEGDEAFANRSKLMDDRSSLQAELDALYNLKRDSAQRFREANDRHWAKVSEDRARRAEKARAQRALEEEAKKKELAERLREEAAEPAFQLQIEDCRTLIDYFSKGAQSSDILSTSPFEKTEVVGVPKLELRKVEAPSDGLVARKKKGEDDESYFVGGKGKKGKKGSAKPNGSSEPATSTTLSQLNIPFATLTALLSLSIPPPASITEISRVVEDLKTKKAWYEANQARVTTEKITKAEAEILRITSGNKHVALRHEIDPASLEPPNGVAEVPFEPGSTHLDKDIPSSEVEAEEVTDKLDYVQEEETADS